MRNVIITLLMLLIMPTVTRSGDFVSGSNTCPTSGNKQVSATKYDLFSLVVTSTITNAGQIHVGGTNVDNSTGGVLTTGASFFVSKNNNQINPATLYFSCTTSTDTISWIGAR